MLQTRDQEPKEGARCKWTQRAPKGEEMSWNLPLQLVVGDSNSLSLLALMIRLWHLRVKPAQDSVPASAGCEMYTAHPKSSSRSFAGQSSTMNWAIFACSPFTRMTPQLHLDLGSFNAHTRLKLRPEEQ